MAVDKRAVAEAVEELQVLVSGDGARLEVLDIDPAAARLYLRLDLSEVGCVDCVLPPEPLSQMIGESIKRRAGEEVEVVVDDPRLSDG
jgi:Fe-S cluster biogenesis protein NfuA